MPIRATKRGDERTPLDGSHDVLICGASFAGLAVARELAGSGADVLVIDRYEIGERQTSACGIPTEWLRTTGPDGRRAPALRLAAHAHPPRRRPLPPALDLLDLRLPRALRAALARLRRPLRDGQGERARRAGRRRRRDRGRDRPRRDLARRSSSTRSAGAGCWPAATATSRPTRRSHAGSRCTRRRAARTWRSGSTAATSPPATAGPSPPATSCGSGSAPSTPASTSATRPSCSPRTWAPTEFATRATGSPTSCAAATEGGVFFAGDSAGHCLPLSAEGIRTALYFGIALGRELRGVVEGRQSREQAAARYAEFNDSHEWKFRWMLRVQRLDPAGPAAPARAR